MDGSIDSDSSSCPWPDTEHDCTTDNLVKYDTGVAPSYVAIVSCTFSCLGSFLIILTFFMLKDMRTGSQKIITLLAIADMISAIGYIAGSANYIHHHNKHVGCGAFNKVCTGQAAVTTYSSLVSFLWTVILAFYFFLIIVFKRVQVASNLMVLYNVIAWGVPLLIVIPLLACNRLGYAHFAASNWCFIKGTSGPNDTSIPLNKDWKTTVIILFGGKLWEILSYVVVTVLYIIITVFISKTRRQVKNTVMEPRVVHVETRLLLIPIIFILLRFWGTLQFFVSIGVAGEIDSHTQCIPRSVDTAFKVLGILQAIGDGGQGWGNAILYIFLSPVIRERLIGEWCGKCMEKLEGLDRVGGARGESSRQANNVQFKGSSSIKRNNKAANGRDDSSETAPFLPGKATGYNIRKYNTTTTATMTEGFTEGYTGTDVSVAT